MRSLRAAIQIEGDAALLDANLVPSFQALRLNQGTSDIREQHLLEANTWQSIKTSESERSGSYCLGLDIGNSAMTAASAYWPETGRLECFGVFPEMPDLSRRGEVNEVGDRYKVMHERGELVLLGCRVVDLDGFVDEIRERWGEPAIMAADRWHENDLRDTLDRSQFPPCRGGPHGQGFKDGAEDLRNFRRACLTDRVRSVPNLLLRSAMGEARSVSDPAGNEKLAKANRGGRRFRHRDDVVAASILAVSCGVRHAGRMKPIPLMERFAFPF